MNHGKNIFADEFVIGPPGSTTKMTSPKSIIKDLKKHVEGGKRNAPNRNSLTGVTIKNEERL